MKSNKQLGFAPLYGDQRYGYGSERSYENSDGGGSLSMHATIGRKGGTYRVYGYLWHNEQDASREGKHAECCARGATPEEALERWCREAMRLGWLSAGIAEIRMEIADRLAEMVDA